MNQAIKPTVPEVLPLVRAYYQKPGNAAGGNLHVVLDDVNIEDQFVVLSLERAKQQHDDDAARIAELLLQMSKTQRRKVAHTHHHGL
jgi:hypothetical protein